MAWSGKNESESDIGSGRMETGNETGHGNKNAFALESEN